MRFLLSAILLVCFGCGGGGSGGNNGGDDDAPPVDGSVNPPPADAPPTNTAGIGTTCTPDANNPQGDCPAGFTCLSLQNGTNPWCSKTCTQGAGDTCAQGYAGPGLASCLLTVTDQNGQNPQNFCGVICQDTTSGNQICPAATCTGTCPATLACSGDLMVTINNMTMVGGKVCQ